MQVHDPYLPPARERELFADPGYAGPIPSDRAELAKLASQSGRRVVDEFRKLVDLEDPEELRHLKALYDACIRYTDEQVGRLLAEASALGPPPRLSQARTQLRFNRRVVIGTAT